MKAIIILFLTILSSCVNQENKSSSSDTEKIDSLFNFHLKKTQDTDHEKSMKFMQELTKIKSKADGDWYGINNATSEDLKLWESWYIANKSNLRWNETAKTIYTVQN